MRIIKRFGRFCIEKCARCFCLPHAIFGTWTNISWKFFERWKNCSRKSSPKKIFAALNHDFGRKKIKVDLGHLHFSLARCQLKLVKKRVGLVTNPLSGSRFGNCSNWSNLFVGFNDENHHFLLEFFKFQILQTKATTTTEALI